MKKRIFLLLLAVILIFSACSGAAKDVSKENSDSGDKSTRIFTDSCGREVELPKDISSVVPSGPLAQIVLYTVCPDKLAGRSNDFSEQAKRFIDEKYWSLPKLGQFYGKNASLNMEELIKTAPDVVIDIGEAKATIREDMDALQEQVGIPVVFIEATLPTMEKAYKMLGELTGDQDHAALLGAYCNKTIKAAEKASSEIDAKDKKSVYFALGDKGLNTNAKGSIHADVIEWIGAINAAKVDAVSTGGGSEVSMEQIFAWDPYVIIADSTALHSYILSDPLWKELDAVKQGRVYKIPDSPYSIMSNPPSVNRILGILWLGNIVYPEHYDIDIVNEFKDFCKNFYSIEMTEEQAKEMLSVN